MTHCGFEPTAVAQTLSSWSGLAGTIRAMVRPNSLPHVDRPFAGGPLVNIDVNKKINAA